MNSVGKFVVKMGMLSLLSVMPLAAQVVHAVNFKTSFPFYAGKTELPAGQYKITQPDMDVNVLLIRSSDGMRSAFVDFTPTKAPHYYGESDVTFKKIGNIGYLNQVQLAGQTTGVDVNPSKVETAAASNANAAQTSAMAEGQ